MLPIEVWLLVLVLVLFGCLAWAVARAEAEAAGDYFGMGSASSSGLVP
jgi:hypothetical protein